MHPTRREMLRLGLGSSALLACGPTVPLFLARSATALTDDRPSAKGRILVVVQLDGGNDGLNTVVPYRDDEYRKRRPKLAIPAGEVKKVDDRWACTRSSTRSRSCWSSSSWRSCRAWATRTRTGRTSTAWRSGRRRRRRWTRRRPAGWRGRSIDRAARDRAATRRACTSTSRSRCRSRWRAGGERPAMRQHAIVFEHRDRTGAECGIRGQYPHTILQASSKLRRGLRGKTPAGSP